jgi:hypothetical protein
MSDLVSGVPAAVPRGAIAAPRVLRPPADARRALQLSLGALWLLDGILQFQPFMFTKDFATNVMAPSAQGNPALVADPITWSARIVAGHPVGTNAAFASIQVLLGLAIAWRPTVRAGLAASVPWALAVWWFGEGFGGVLNGTASPLSGAPGGVVLYALLAVLLWPSDRPGTFPAARAVGAQAARGLWLLLWGSLAFFAVQPANTGPQDVHDMIAGMADGQPGWLASLMNGAARLTAGRGPAVSIALAVVLAAIAVAVYLPWPVQRWLLAGAVGVAALIWVCAQALGGLYGGQGTDPNSGPLLALLALAYWRWPIRDEGAPPPATAPTAAAAVSGEGTVES